MLDTLITQILDFINANSYIGLFVFGMFNFIIPSEPVLVYAGYRINLGELSFPLVILSALAGSFIKASVIYGIGYYLGKSFLIKYSKFTHFKEEYITYLKNKVSKYGYWIVTPIQFIPIVRRFVSAPAGLIKLNFQRFMFYNLIGVAGWFSFLATVGIIFGKSWNKVAYIFAPYLEVLKDLAIGLFVFLIAYEIYLKIKEIRSGNYEN